MQSDSGLAAALAEIESPNELVAALIKNSQFAIQVYRADGRSLYVNPAFMEMFHVAPPPEYSIFKDEIAEKSGVLPLIKRAFGGEPMHLPVTWFDPGELRHVTVVGARKVAVDSKAIPILNRKGIVTHVVFTGRDATAEQLENQNRQKTLKALGDANTLIQDILNGTKAVIFVKGLDSKYLIVNRQYLEIFNLSADQVIGKIDHDFMPKEIADQLYKHDTEILQSGEGREIEETVVHADGIPHTYISLKFAIKDSKGEIYGICGIATDITDSRRLEKELGTARRMESLGIIASGIAHDFNNILGVILMHAEALPGAEIIQMSAQRASELTRKLLAFGRKQVADPVAMNLNAIINDVRDILNRLVGEDIRLHIETEQNSGFILADPSQIEQVLMNLCLNSRDAMQGGGEITISTHNVKASARSGEFVELRVCDTGHGMSTEVKERIFEPFFSTKERDKGSGLGLSSVYGIMQDCGGEIVVESEVNKGTTFRLTFPRIFGSAITQPVSKPHISEWRGSDTVLIIDDEAVLRKITAIVLRDRGFKVYEAADMNEAVGVLRDLPKGIQLIVSDVIMPDINGPALISHLDQLGLVKKAKILYVSGHSDFKIENCGVSHLSEFFLQKPYGSEKLLEKIRSILREPQ